MRKLEKRAVICLTMAAVLLAGLILYITRFVENGGTWATFYGNRSIYTNGHLTRGAVYDVNGVLLVKNTAEGTVYNDDPEVREATAHVVGDMKDNIPTAVMSAYKDRIIGYNLITGTYSFSDKGKEFKLTIDSEISKVAYNALNGRNGFVGVYNYETGEVLCMVSTPTLDPINPPDNPPSGTYINKVISGKFTPGSIFKVLTSAAAIENISDIDKFSYYCTGTKMINGVKLNCFMPHGRVNFEDALAKSCNGAFAEITEKLGPQIMKEYVKKCGLTKSYDLNGIKTAKGSFEFPEKNIYNLCWSGIGQYKDQINPFSMMVFMGAIANGGEAPAPYLIKDKKPIMGSKSSMIDTKTAQKLTEMLKHNVQIWYGGDRAFPGLDMYGKSGTAEVGNGDKPTAWFTGFIKNSNCPYAFIVGIEDGGFGVDEALPVARKVMNAVVNSRGV